MHLVNLYNLVINFFFPAIQNPAEWLGDDTAMTEQPSPVSVLDAALYIEDSPSPVKKISRVFRGTNTALQNIKIQKNIYTNVKL